MTSRFSEIPINRFLNFSLISPSNQSTEITMPLKESYTQEGGVIHGGLIASLADTAAVYILFPNLPDDRTMTSIEFKMNFLSPALLEKGDLRAVATLVKRGRKVAVCEVDVFQQNKLIAKGLFTYLFFQK